MTNYLTPLRLRIGPSTPRDTASMLRTTLASMTRRFVETVDAADLTTVSADSAASWSALADLRAGAMPVIVTDVDGLTPSRLRQLRAYAGEGAPVAVLLSRRSAPLAEDAQNALRVDLEQVTVIDGLITQASPGPIRTRGLLIEQLAILGLVGIDGIEAERVALTLSGYSVRGRRAGADVSLAGVIDHAEQRLELHLTGSDFRWTFSQGAPHLAMSRRLTREDARGVRIWPLEYETPVRSQLAHFFRSLSGGGDALVGIDDVERYSASAASILTRLDDDPSASLHPRSRT